MEFVARLNALAKKVESQKESITTEEATKNAFVMPFLSSVLGYDVFNPHEVVPEFTADVGTKRGEKIDYAILHNGEVQILVECKTSTTDLKFEHASQLFRYFAVTNARIAVLTNGEVYQFYTDLDRPNRMDERPFLILDLADVDDAGIPELQKLAKSDFDLESVINAAEELKYVGAIKRALSEEMREPSPEWVKYLTARVYEGSFTQRVREQFTPLVQKAAKQYLSDQVNDRLKAALGAGIDELATTAPTEAVSSAPVAEEDLRQDPDIETTLEELEGYQIVKAIACSLVKPQRIVHRDSKSYFAVLLDDNNRKPIARLHFNGRTKRIGLLDAEKKETRYELESLDAIYEHAEAIREAVGRYAE